MYRVILLVFLFCSTQALGQKLLFVAESLPPYHYYDHKGKPVGVLVDVVHALQFQTKTQIEIQLLPMARAHQMTKHKSNVFLFSLLKTPNRVDSFQWIGQVYQIEPLLIGLASRKNLKLESLQQAKKRIVGTVRGYFAEEFLLNAGFVKQFNLHSAVDYRQLWQMLKRQRIDYVLTNSMSLDTELKSIDMPSQLVAPYFRIDDFPDQLHIATGLSTDKAIVTQLQVGLLQLKQSGEYQKIMQRWQ